MLTKKRQRRFLTEKEQRWLHALVAFDESRDEKTLHRLRLEIKKIRALVEFARFYSGKRAAAHFSGLKKMFRQAGMIRDACARIRFLEERQLLSSEHKDRQARSIQLATEVFAAHIRHYRKIGKKASRRLKTDVQAIGAKRIRRWYACEIIETGLLLGGTGDQLHEARKRIKAMLYLGKILPEEIVERLRLNTGYLDRLQDMIGQWHDGVVVMMHLAEDNAAGKRVVESECQDREREVRVLAGRFDRMAHLT